MVMYTFICFSPLVENIEVKFAIGYISMVTVSMHLVVNFSIIGMTTFKKVKLLLLLKLAKRKHKKQRKALKQRLEKKRDAKVQKMWKRKMKVEGQAICQGAHLSR